MSGLRRILLLAAGLALFVPSVQSDSPSVRDRQAVTATQLPGTDLHGDSLPAGARARLGTVRFRYPGPVHSLRFSPDGKVLATIGSSPVLCLWDAATGKELRRFQSANGGYFSSLAFSPDGKTLAVTDGHQKIRLLDLATGKEVRPFDDPANGANAVAFSPDGKMLAAANGGNRIGLWDVATGKEFRHFIGPEQKKPPEPGVAANLVMRVLQDQTVTRFCQDRLNLSINVNQIDRQLRPFSVYSVAFSMDGTTLAAGGLEGNNEGIIRLWDVTSGKELQPLKAPTNGLYHLVFSRDGKTLAAAGGDQLVRLWDVATWKERGQLPRGQGNIGSLAFSPDDKWLAAGNYYGPFRVWEMATGQEVRKFEELGRVAAAVAFSPDSRTLATSDNSGVIRLWDVASVKEVHPQIGHHTNIGAVAYSTDGQVLATAGGDRTIRLWHAATGKELRQLELLQPPPKNDNSNDSTRPLIAFSRDGKTLAGGTPEDVSSGLIRLWNAATGKEIGLLKGHQGIVSSVVFSAHGRTVITGGHDGTARLWDVATGKELRQFPFNDTATPPNGLQSNSGVVSVALSPDGRSLATGWTGQGGNNNLIRVWEMATGTQRGRMEVKSDVEHGGLWEFRFGGLRGNSTPLQLAFSPDGKALAIASASRIRLWELARGIELRQFAVQEGTVDSVTFTPDGRHLAAGSSNGAVRFWEAATGTVRYQFEAQRGGSTSIAFTRDGRSLASAGADTAAMVWDVNALLEAARTPPATAPSQDAQEALWTALGGVDAAKAFQARLTLAATPEQTISFLRAHLHPVSNVDPRQVEQLLADLDHELFVNRQKATEELERLAELVEPDLQQLLQNKPSLEVRQRTERLLQKLEGSITSPEKLRLLRSVELLEQIGSRDAQEILQTLAKGTPAARLTQDARAALERLTVRADLP